MTRKNLDSAMPNGVYLSPSGIIEDPTEVLPTLQQDLRKWELFFHSLEKSAASKEGLDSPAAKEYYRIREFLQELVGPRLRDIERELPSRQVEAVNLLTPFDTRGGLRDFIAHFFQVAPDGKGGLKFAARDRFERELYVFHDLYKVTKTLEVIEVICKARGKFKSRFSKHEQEKILAEMGAVLDVLFSQALPVEHRERVRARISPACLSASSLLKRREKELTYFYPHMLEQFAIRQLFFLIFFKEGLKAKTEEEGEKDYAYSFMDFQALKREFLTDWLTEQLTESEAKFAAYQLYEFWGQPLLHWYRRNPKDESAMLALLPAPIFYEIIERINQQLSGSDRLGFDVEVENAGIFHELKRQLAAAAGWARLSLAALSRLVEGGAADAPAQPEEGDTQDADSGSAGEEAGSAGGETRWDVCRLSAEEVGHPYFLRTGSVAYGPHLNAMKVQLGEGYAAFSALVTRLLQNLPEEATIRRITPKREWAVPFLIGGESDQGRREYLLILGAQVKAAGRGMGYQSGENYKFTPYFVLAAAQPEDELGTTLGDRSVRGRAFAEHDCRSAKVCDFAIKLLEVLKAQGRQQMTAKATAETAPGEATPQCANAGLGEETA